MKKKISIIAGLGILSVCLLLILSSLNKKETSGSIPAAKMPPCNNLPACDYYKQQISMTYAMATGNKCLAVIITINGILSGECNCDGVSFDRCGLRQWAISTFPACNFTLSSFKSSCP